MRKSIRLITLSVLTLILSSCINNSSSQSSGSGNTDRGPATEIKIYAGGSSEYSWRKESKEAEVYKAVEDKYYEDTGINLKFNVQFFGQSMKNAITTGITDGSIDVVISHLGGGDGIDDWVMQNGLYRNLIDDFDNYEYLDKHMEWTDGDKLELNAKSRVTTRRSEIVAFPSVINPYKFGILVRKDWMEKLGFSDVEKEGYELVDNFETFERMAKLMKDEFNLSHAISGAIYEVEKTGILGAHNVPAGYYTMSKAKHGEVDIVDIGGLINPDYSHVLDMESRWIKNGILPVSPDAKKVDDHEADFFAGRSGIFVENPNVTHLIEVARKTKQLNPEAEFTVLEALTKDKESTAKGFMRNSVATFGAVITKNTPDANRVLGFLNWVYSSVENYNLCRYGVEGVHYFLEEGVDSVTGDTVYMYSYPEGFDFENKPYSGILTLVENQNISDLQYAGFTTEEERWIRNAKNKDNYLINDTVDYLLINQNKVNLNLHFANRKDMYNTTQKIWAGSSAFIYDYVHAPGQDFNTDNVFNHTDRMAKVNNYLQGTSVYSREVFELYQTLVNNAKYL